MSEDDAEKPKGVAELYFPPNKLARAIGVGNGPSLREMEEEAEKRLLAKSQDYEQILRTTIDRMKTSLHSDASVSDIQDMIFSDAHDIKGQAPLFDYPLVSEIAVCICVAIKDVPEKLEVRPDLLELHINALDWAFQNQNNDARQAEKSALVQSLNDALASD